LLFGWRRISAKKVSSNKQSVIDQGVIQFKLMQWPHNNDDCFIFFDSLKVPVCKRETILNFKMLLQKIFICPLHFRNH
jgi:hypothetical protein